MLRGKWIISNYISTKIPICVWCVCVVCRGQRLISGVSYCYPPLSFEKDSFIESGACHSHSSQARSWRAPGTFLSPPPPLSDSSARVMDVCWAQLFHECWGYKLRFSCTCSHNFTYRAIPRPQSYSVKKKRWNDPYLKKYTTNRMWTDKRSFLRRNRLWDFPLYITLGAGLQSYTQTGRGPCPHLLPLEPELIVYHFKPPWVHSRGDQVLRSYPREFIHGLDGT